MPRLTLLKTALLVVCCGLTMAGQKKPAEQKAAARENQPANEEKNKNTARLAFEDLWGQGRSKPTMYENNAIVHWNGRNFSVAQMEAEGKEMRAAFPDLVVQPNQITAQGEMVEVHFTAHGTNKGQRWKTSGKGKQAATQGVTKMRFDSAGKIAEAWVDWDENDVHRQVADK
jgi:predicted ester cyclase